MKSEKAKKTLENSAKYVRKYRAIQGCRPFDEFVLLKNAERAVELAEQEAEERMRQKAIKAFRHFVMEYHCKEASCPKREKCDSSCVISQYFIQKLTEE